MLSTFSPYSQQALTPQFMGAQGGGLPQGNPAFFGQPGAFGATAPFGYDSGQGGFGQYSQAGPTNPFLQYPSLTPLQSHFSQLPQSPFAASISPGQWPTSPFTHGQFANSFASPTAVQHIVAALGQLAQQISIQGVLTQQVAATLHQLVQQLAIQSAQTNPTAALGAMQSSFAAPVQSPYAGFTPQGWGANRPQTIQ